MKKDHFADQRNEMLEQQIISRGVRDDKVMKSMARVPRHLFVPENSVRDAYGDFPLPIGHGQTISQPYIVALMTELLSIDDQSRVLEIGTGSGYQTAVLAEISAEVFTVELVPELYRKSVKLLKDLGYKNIRQKLGDGYGGWQEHGPYDGIVVTAAPEEIPEELKNQLKENGRLVIPVGGTFEQTLLLIKKQNDQFTEQRITGVRFVKLVKTPADH